MTVPELVEITGLSRATVYRRLGALADAGDAAQDGDGRVGAYSLSVHTGASR